LDAAALGGRLLIAALFLLSGASKVSSPEMTIGYIESAGLPLPLVGYFVALLIEIVGAIVLILGFQTRLVASAMAAFTLAAALAFHNKLGDQNQFIHFFKNISIVGGLLQVIAFGGGRLSIDARLSR
jgi:putative oxidoreductase